MTKVLDQLWGGEIRPCDRTVRRGGEYERLQKIAQTQYDRYWSLLTPEAKEAYKAFEDANLSLMSISDRDFFVKGFRLGVQMMLAAICEDDTQLPQLEEA